MYEVYLTLFLGLLTTKVNTTSTTLPIVLIKQENGDLTNPQCMTSYKTDDDGYLTTETTFQLNPQDPNAKQAFYCAADHKNGGEDIMENLTETDKYCLFETPITSSAPLRCTEEPEPYLTSCTEVKPSGFHGRVYCGPEDKEGEMYAYQYKVCIPHDMSMEPNDRPIKHRHVIEIFRFCYSRKRKQVLYTQHTIKSPSFLNDARLVKEQEHTFPTRAMDYGCRVNNFVDVQKAYDRLKNGDVSKAYLQKIINTSDIDVIAQKLVPHEDLVFALWRKTTYHVLNFRPMRNDPTKVWEYASKLIRDDAISKNIEYEIFTGAFMVFPEISEKSTILQVADIWIKIIHHKLPAPTSSGIQDTKSFAVILNNNLERPVMNSVFQRICAENLCENALTAKFPELDDTARCCYAKQIALKFFNMKFDSDAHFLIDSLGGKKIEENGATNEN